jgi:hypothetical protein
MYTSIVLVAMLSPAAEPQVLPTTGSLVWQPSYSYVSTSTVPVVAQHATPSMGHVVSVSHPVTYVNHVSYGTVSPPMPAPMGHLGVTYGPVTSGPVYHGSIGATYTPVTYAPVYHGGISAPVMNPPSYSGTIGASYAPLSTAPVYSGAIYAPAPQARVYTPSYGGSSSFQSFGAMPGNCSSGRCH